MSDRLRRFRRSLFTCAARLALAAVSVSAAMFFRVAASQYVSATGGPRQGWERDETRERLRVCALAAKDTSKAAKSEERASAWP